MLYLTQRFKRCFKIAVEPFLFCNQFFLFRLEVKVFSELNCINVQICVY